MSAETVLTSLIAVSGTLTAGGLTSWWHARTARSERREHRTQQHAHALLSAVAKLVAALDAHRAAMWLREHTRLTAGHDTARLDLFLERTHETRAAVSAPLTRVRVLAPSLATAATTATQATYDMRNAADDEALQAQRVVSIESIAALEAATAALIAATV